MFNQGMTRTFIQTTIFSHQWEQLGFNDDDLRRLELTIMQNPDAGPVIQGTGGLRKIRFAFNGRGKSGSTRVCYVDFVYYETVYLITVYTKNQKENLSRKERNNIKKAIALLESEIRKNSRGNENE